MGIWTFREFGFGQKSSGSASFSLPMTYLLFLYCLNGAPQLFDKCWLLSEPEGKKASHLHCWSPNQSRIKMYHFLKILNYLSKRLVGDFFKFWTTEDGMKRLGNWERAKRQMRIRHGGNRRGGTSVYIRCCYRMGVMCCTLFYKSQKCGEGGKL
jgi:hypothetical protein